MDFVFDVIFGLLLELFKAVCPDYELKKWQSALLIVLGLIVLFATIGCFVAGLVLLNEYAEHKALGVALTAVGVSLFLIDVCQAFFSNFLNFFEKILFVLCLT